MALFEFIADRLRELRREHELTQEQVALLLDTDLRWYQRVESGQRDIRASTIERFAAIYGISALEFLGKEMPKSRVRKRPPGAPHKTRRRTKRKPVR